MIKKIILGLLALILIGVGTLFLINGKDNYNATKYSASTTDGVNINSKLDFTLPDQFDNSHTLTDSTKKIIFVFTKDTGHTVKTFLKKEDRDYLIKRDTLFVADISPMPTVIRNTFALPDLRKSAYSVLLIYDSKIAKQFKKSSKSNKITLLTLEKRVVKSVKYLSNAEELKAELN